MRFSATSASTASIYASTAARRPSRAETSWAVVSNRSALTLFGSVPGARCRQRRFDFFDAFRDVRVRWIARENLLVRPQREAERIGIALALVKPGQRVERVAVMFFGVAGRFERLGELRFGAVELTARAQHFGDGRLCQHAVFFIHAERTQHGQRIFRLPEIGERKTEPVTRARIRWIERDRCFIFLAGAGGIASGS